MKDILEFLQDFCDELKEKSGVLNVYFISKYPGVLKPTPLTKIVISVGINKIGIENSHIGGKDEKKQKYRLRL